jgi:serine/threonine-protein kinase
MKPRSVASLLNERDDQDDQDDDDDDVDGDGHGGLDADDVSDDVDRYAFSQAGGVVELAEMTAEHRLKPSPSALGSRSSTPAPGPRAASASRHSGGVPDGIDTGSGTRPRPRATNDDASAYSGPLMSEIGGDDDSSARRHAAADDAVPEHERAFGPYTLLRRLAFGGMGEVFLARDAAGKNIVIKRVLGHMRRDEKHRQMFIDEARIQTMLRSRNIVEVFDVGDHQGHTFLAMEHVHGPSWRAIIDRCRQRRQHIPVAYVVDVMMQACEALSYAHNLKDDDGQPLRVVHRDINPHNVLVTYGGVVKLIDFGIAKSELREQQTETGTIKGKFAYMSPEQSAAEPLDARSDLFALGICLYELLALQNPFKRSNVVLSLEAIQRTTPKPLFEVRPGASMIDPIVERMLRKNPDERFFDCREVREALGQLSRDGLLPEPQQPLSSWLRELFADEIAHHQSLLDAVGGEVAVLDDDDVVPFSGEGSAEHAAVDDNGDGTRPSDGDGGTAPTTSRPSMPQAQRHPGSRSTSQSASLRAAQRATQGASAPQTDDPADVDDGDNYTGPTGALQIKQTTAGTPWGLAAGVSLATATVLVLGFFIVKSMDTGEVENPENPALVVVTPTTTTDPATRPTTDPTIVGDSPGGGDAIVVDKPGDADPAVDPAVDTDIDTDVDTDVGGDTITPPDDPKPDPDVTTPVKVKRPKVKGKNTKVDKAPAPPPVARVVVAADGFVVKGSRSIAENGSTTLLVDDADAPFAVKIRVKHDEQGAVANVSSTPWAIVRVDQMGKGRTPLNGMRLDMGKKLLISLQNPSGAQMDIDLTVVATDR